MRKIRLPTAHELTALAGFCMAGYGLYLIYPPVMWLLCGIWLMIPPRRKGGGQ